MYRIGLHAKPSNKAMAAVYQGAQSIGLRPFFRNPNAFKAKEAGGCDIAVAMGLSTTGRTVRDAYQAAGIPVFLMDAGYIFRDQGYKQFGLYDLNWLPDKAPHDRAQAMGLIAQNKRKQGEFVLVCNQLPGDNQHNIDVDQWLKQTISVLEASTDMPVYSRPHPRVEKPQNTLTEALEGCHCLVTHNSTAAYEAIRQGVSVICDPCAVYSDICETRLEKVNTPKMGGKAKRQKLLDRVAYAQWTHAEFETGEPLKFLLEQIGHDDHAG